MGNTRKIPNSTDMGRFRIKPKSVRDPIEEAFERVWKVGAKNDFRMLPPEYQNNGRSDNPLLKVLRDGRRGIQLALANATVQKIENESTMDLFSGEAAVPFTLLRLGSVPNFKLVDCDEAYERKCTAMVQDFRFTNKVDFLRRQIVPERVQRAMETVATGADELMAAVIKSVQSIAMPLPETRQVTIISTGIGLPQALRGKGTSSFSEALSGMLGEGPEEFIRRFAANSRHLHIHSIELNDVLWRLSEFPRRVIMVDQPETNVPNLENAVREHVGTELDRLDGPWRHTFTEQQDADGTIVSELVHT